MIDLLKQIKNFIKKNKQKQNKEEVLSKTTFLKNENAYKKFKYEKLTKRIYKGITEEDYYRNNNILQLKVSDYFYKAQHAHYS